MRFELVFSGWKPEILTRLDDYCFIAPTGFAPMFEAPRDPVLVYYTKELSRHFGCFW